MDDHEGHGCDSIGRRTGLLCACIGVLVAAGMCAVFGLGQWLRTMQYQILVGLFALFFAAAFLGKKAAMCLCQRGNRLWMSLALGVGVAFGSISIALLTGSILTIVSNGVRNAAHFFDVMLAPQLLVLVFGGIPAIVLGVIYGCMVGDRLARLER